jgi:quercetin dioxygenase-like cupin family protein
MIPTVSRPRALVVAAALVCATLFAGASQAQALPRSYVASPDVYKVIAESAQYQVIEATWKPGQRDAAHSHPANAVYYVTDCKIRLYSPEGRMVYEATPRAGAALVQPPIPGHMFENAGDQVCKLIMFEPR